jgi:hypothetical protein
LNSPNSPLDAPLNLRERDQWEDLGVDVKIILQWDGDMAWFDVVEGRRGDGK